MITVYQGHHEKIETEGDAPDKIKFIPLKDTPFDTMITPAR
jgi:hypothetical protein